MEPANTHGMWSTWSQTRQGETKTVLNFSSRPSTRRTRPATSSSSPVTLPCARNGRIQAQWYPQVFGRKRPEQSYDIGSSIGTMQCKSKSVNFKTCYKPTNRNQTPSLADSRFYMVLEYSTLSPKESTVKTIAATPSGAYMACNS